MPLTITLGVSTWLWKSPFKTDDAAELFAKVKRMGFDKIEIAVEDPSLIDVKEVKSELANNGLDAILCGAFGSTRDLTNEDESLRRVSMDYISRCLDIAVGLDTDFFAGPMYSAVGKARMVPPQQRELEWNLAVENLHAVCERAAERQLRIALEPLNRFESDLVNNVTDLTRMIAEIDHPAAGICLDMFHMNIEEPDPEKAIRMAGDRLLHIQVAENYRGTPGSGNASWEKYYRGLEAIGYTGTVSIESFTPENQELAAAVCIWRNLAESQDAFASEGYDFLRKWATGKTNIL